MINPDALEAGPYPGITLLKKASTKEPSWPLEYSTCAGSRSLGRMEASPIPNAILVVERA
jgi:hypothetical protein